MAVMTMKRQGRLATGSVDPPGADDCSPPALNAKACKILEGARSAFHEFGFEGASVDEIARRAGVSKPTLYTYFGDKQALFAASFARECQSYAESVFGRKHEEIGEDIEAALRRLARQFVTFLLSPFSQNMFRSAVAESSRFPDLGRAYYDIGPRKARSHVKELLSGAVERGTLAIDDIDLAAHQLVELCKADAFDKQVFFVTEQTSEADIGRIADGAVTLFFNGYRPRP